jgi:hypothetical protein
MAVALRQLDGAEIRYPDMEAETADLIEELYRDTRQLLEARWGLRPPPALRLVVLRGWWQPLFHVGPLWQRLVAPLLVVIMPGVLRQAWQVGAV